MDLVTTIDNPFDPFTEYDRWRKFDMDKGYYTESRLARLLDSSLDTDDSELVKAFVYSAQKKLVKISPIHVFTNDIGGVRNNADPIEPPTVLKKNRQRNNRKSF